MQQYGDFRQYQNYEIAVKPPTFAPMRFIAFILAILVLGLSLMPCADGQALTFERSKQKHEQTKPISQQNDEDHEDACSPFCQCTCCAGFSLNHEIGSITFISFTLQQSFTSWIEANTIEISLPIWQPPQLSA